MIKKIKIPINVLGIFGCLMLATLTHNTSLLYGESMDELLQNLNLDTFLKEMEKSYAEETGKRAAENLPIQTAPEQEKEQKISITQKKHPPKTRDQLFLSPNTEIVEEAGKPKETLLTQESIDAFKSVMLEFMTQLSAVQNKIDGTSLFSLPFKEQFARYHESIDKIAISYGTMVSKKLYATIIPYTDQQEDRAPMNLKAQTQKTPIAGTSTLRKNILDAIKELKKLNAELETVMPNDEEDLGQKAIKKLAQQQQKQITFTDETLTPTHPKNRQATPKKSTAKPKVKSVAPGAKP